MLSPSGLNAALRTYLVCPSSGLPTGSSVSEFHSRAVRSSEAVTISLPFGLKSRCVHMAMVPR